jgi:serine/threonine protein kinase
LYDVLESAKNYYLIQEFCESGDLKSMLKAKTTIPEREALFILADLLTGFLELLRCGVIHRDLKPENILKS